MVESIGLMIAAIVLTHLVVSVARSGNRSDSTAVKAFVLLTVVVLVVSGLILLAITSGSGSNPP